MNQLVKEPTQKPIEKTSENGNVPAVIQESIVDQILNKVSRFQTEGGLMLPGDYSAENAIRSAWLILQDTLDKNSKPVLQSCTRQSIANSLFDMVTKALSVAKKQGYFIAYGNELAFDESYLGAIAIAKRTADVKDVYPMPVYKDDEFTYEIKKGKFRVLSHVQNLANIAKDKLVGAYAIIEYNDGREDCEIMSMEQIRDAWNQGPIKGQSPAHKNFPDQMAMKTVIKRGLKIDIGSSDDSNLFVNRRDPVSAHIQQEINAGANRKTMSMPEQTQDVEAIAEDASVDKTTGEVFTPDEKVSEKQVNGKASTQTLGPGF